MECWPEYRRTWELIGRGPHLYIFLIQLYIASAVPPPAGILHVPSQRTSDMHIFRQSGAREAQQEFDRELKLGPNRPSFRNVLCL